MGVTVIDSGEGALSRAIASVGDALGKRLRERQNNADRIIRNPARFASVAEAYRAALNVSDDAGATLIESLRVPDDFGDTLLALQATPAELGRAADIEGDVPGRVSAGKGITADLVVAKAEAEISSGVIETELNARIATGDLTAASVEALLGSGVIDSELAERLAVSLLGADTATVRRDVGIPEAEAAADLGTAAVTTAKTGQIITQNLAEAEVTAARMGALVAGQRDEVLLNSGMIALSSKNDLRQIILDGKRLTAEQILDLPRVRVVTELGVLTQQQLEAEYQVGLIRHRIVEGVPQLTISREVLQLNADIAGITDSIRFAKAAGEYLDSLDQTTANGRRLFNEFILGMENPSFLAHIGIHEQLTERARLTRAAVSASTSAEIFSNTLTMMQEIEDAVNALAEADSDERPFARLQLENLRHLSAKMMVSGRLEPIDLIGADMHGKRFEYFYTDIDSDAVHFAIGVAGEGLLDGESSEKVLEDIHEPQDEFGGRSLYDTMSPRDQEMFDEKFPVLIEDVEAARGIIATRLIVSRPSPREAEARTQAAQNREVVLSRARETMETAPRELLTAQDAGDKRQIGILERRIGQAQRLLAQGPLFDNLMILPGTSPQDLLDLVNATFPEVGNLPR